MTTLELTSPPAVLPYVEDLAASEARHPLIRTLDRIFTLPVPAAARAVLVCLARHGRWDDGSECRPSIATICRWTALSERQTQRLLRYLACGRLEGPHGLCIGDRHCPHWGLVQLERPASPGRPATFRLSLEPAMFQLDMPEVGAHALDAAGFVEPRGCREEGCGEPHHARGLCNAHYHAAKRRNAGQRPARGRAFGSERTA